MKFKQQIGMGCMPLSIKDRPSEKEGIAVIHAALDEGTVFFDTADVYCMDNSDIGHNEQLIAKALRLKKNNSTVVATKGGLTRPEGRWENDAHPESLRKACDRSLKSLGVETIALYQLHAPDPRVPFEDSVGELARLQKEGKIQHVGLSNVSLQQLTHAREIVEIVSVQNRCHPFFKRDFKNGLIDACARLGVNYLPYSTVGGHFGHHSYAKDGIFTQLSKKYDVSTYAVILRWHLAKGEHILPIPGASKISSAVDSARAVRVKLDANEVAMIDGLPDLG